MPMRQPARSMLDTSIVLTAGMLAMTASEFNGFLYLGGFTAWSVVAALITDLLLLGPLLVLLDDRTTRVVVDATEPQEADTKPN